MNATDQALLQQWVDRRDAEAFRTIALRHAAMVYNTSRRILRDPHDAEEVAQECFEALVKAGEKPGAYLGAWLHRVATNLSLNRIAAGRRRQTREDRYAEATEPAAELFDAELYAHVDKAIAALPDKLRQPLVAHYLENLTHDAIAESIGVSRQTVTYRISQGVERVRADLNRKGVMVTAGGLSAFLLANNGEAAPAGLATALGKMAVAGAPATAAGMGLAAVHGFLSLKGALAGAAIIALGGAGTLVLRSELMTGRPAAAMLVASTAPVKAAAVQPAPAAKPKRPQSPAPVAPAAGAPVPLSAPKSVSPAPAPHEDATARQRRVEALLAQPVSMEFENIRLDDILSFISDSYDLNFALDPRVVQSESVGPPDYVTDGKVPYIDVRNVTLGTALRTLCRPLGLDFAMNGGVITVSSPALLDADRFTRLNDGDDSDSEALQRTVSLAFEDVHLAEILEFAADTYDVNITIDHRAVAPAEGQIPQGQPEPPFVTTGHVPHVSLKNVSITQALDSLLRPMNLAYSVEPGFVWVSSPDLIAQEAFIEPDTSHAEPTLVEALQTPNDFEFDKAFLSEALTAMAQRAGVSIEVDTKNTTAVATATVNNFEVKELPFSTALSIILRKHNLAFAVNGQDIIVTSPTGAHSNNPAQLSFVPIQQIAKD